MLRKSLSLYPFPHPDRHISLIHLGHELWARFQRTGLMNDLEEAISIYRELLSLYPTFHPDRFPSLNNLAVVLQTRFEHYGGITDL